MISVYHHGIPFKTTPLQQPLDADSHPAASVGRHHRVPLLQENHREHPHRANHQRYVQKQRLRTVTSHHVNILLQNEDAMIGIVSQKSTNIMGLTYAIRISDLNVSRNLQKCIYNIVVPPNKLQKGRLQRSPQRQNNMAYGRFIRFTAVSIFLDCTNEQMFFIGTYFRLQRLEFTCFIVQEKGKYYLSICVESQ